MDAVVKRVSRILIVSFSLLFSIVSTTYAYEVPAGYRLRYCHAPEKLKAEKVEMTCPASPGATYLAYREDAEAVVDEWPQTGEKYTFIGSQGQNGLELSETTIYGGYPKEYVTHAWFDLVCEGNGEPPNSCETHELKKAALGITEQLGSEGLNIFIRILIGMTAVVVVVLLIPFVLNIAKRFL